MSEAIKHLAASIDTLAVNAAEGEAEIKTLTDKVRALIAASPAVSTDDSAEIEAAAARIDAIASGIKTATADAAAAIAPAAPVEAPAAATEAPAEAPAEAAPAATEAPAAS